MAEDLEKRLKAARQGFDEDYNPKPDKKFQEKYNNDGYKYLAYIIAGFIFGFGIDKLFNISPIGIVIGVIGSFILIIRKSIHDSKKNSTLTGQK